jgi:16S rRNA processing protein RimM
MSNQGDKRVCLGAIAGAHGVKGAVKIKTFTERPEDVGAYGPLVSEDGKRRFTLKVLQRIKDDVVLATAPEIRSREDAMALGGVRLYVDRARLPALADADEFYIEDLVGLEARDLSGARIGRVAGVHNFGAGDVIEIARDGAPACFAPFTRAAAPGLDIAAGWISFAPEAFGDAAESDDGMIAEEMRQADA